VRVVARGDGLIAPQASDRAIRPVRTSQYAAGAARRSNPPGGRGSVDDGPRTLERRARRRPHAERGDGQDARQARACEARRARPSAGGRLRLRIGLVAPGD
jgi:hypothetical protein